MLYTINTETFLTLWYFSPFCFSLITKFIQYICLIYIQCSSLVYKLQTEICQVLRPFTYSSSESVKFSRLSSSRSSWQNNSSSGWMCTDIFRDALLGSGPESGWTTGLYRLFLEPLLCLLCRMLHVIVWNVVLQSRILSTQENVSTQNYFIFF